MWQHLVNIFCLLLLVIALAPQTRALSLPTQLFCVDIDCTSQLTVGKLQTTVTDSDGNQHLQGQSIDVVAKSAQPDNSLAKIRIDNQYYFIDSSLIHERDPPNVSSLQRVSKDFDGSVRLLSFPTSSKREAHQNHVSKSLPKDGARSTDKTNVVKSDPPAGNSDPTTTVPPEKTSTIDGSKSSINPANSDPLASVHSDGTSFEPTSDDELASPTPGSTSNLRSKNDTKSDEVKSDSPVTNPDPTTTAPSEKTSTVDESKSSINQANSDPPASVHSDGTSFEPTSDDELTSTPGSTSNLRSKNDTKSDEVKSDSPVTNPDPTTIASSEKTSTVDEAKSIDSDKKFEDPVSQSTPNSHSSKSAEIDEQPDDSTEAVLKMETLPPTPSHTVTEPTWPQVSIPSSRPPNEIDTTDTMNAAPPDVIMPYQVHGHEPPTEKLPENKVTASNSDLPIDDDASKYSVSEKSQQPPPKHTEATNPSLESERSADESSSPNLTNTKMSTANHSSSTIATDFASERSSADVMADRESRSTTDDDQLKSASAEQPQQPSVDQRQGAEATALSSASVSESTGAEPPSVRYNNGASESQSHERPGDPNSVHTNITRGDTEQPGAEEVSTVSYNDHPSDASSDIKKSITVKPSESKAKTDVHISDLPSEDHSGGKSAASSVDTDPMSSESDPTTAPGSSEHGEKNTQSSVSEPDLMSHGQEYPVNTDDGAKAYQALPSDSKSGYESSSPNRPPEDRSSDVNVHSVSAQVENAKIDNAVQEAPNHTTTTLHAPDGIGEPSVETFMNLSDQQFVHYASSNSDHMKDGSIHRACDAASSLSVNCVVWLNPNGTLAFPEAAHSPSIRAIARLTGHLLSVASQLTARLPDLMRVHLDRLLRAYTALSLDALVAWSIVVLTAFAGWLVTKVVRLVLPSGHAKPPPPSTECLVLEERLVQLTDRLTDQERANGQLANWVSRLTAQLRTTKDQLESTQSHNGVMLDDLEQTVEARESELSDLRQAHLEHDKTLQLLAAEKDSRIADLQSEIGRLTKDKECQAAEWKTKLDRLDEDQQTVSKAAKEEQEQLYVQAMDYFDQMKSMQTEVDKLLAAKQQAEDKLVETTGELIGLRESFTALKSFELALQEHNLPEDENRREETEQSSIDSNQSTESPEILKVSNDNGSDNDGQQESDESLNITAIFDDETEKKVEEAEGPRQSEEETIADKHCRERAALSANMSIFLDVGRLRVDINSLQVQLSSEKLNLKFERELRVELETKVSEAESRLIDAELQCKRLSEERSAAESKLDCLSNYFRERESQLQQNLDQQVSVGTESSEALQSLHRRTHDLEGELKTLRDQLTIVRRELDETQRNSRRQVTELEKRSHGNMLAARTADRQASELRDENTQLRNLLMEAKSVVAGKPHPNHNMPLRRQNMPLAPHPPGMPFFPPPPPPPPTSSSSGRPTLPPFPLLPPTSLGGGSVPPFPMVPPSSSGGQWPPFMIPPPPPPPMKLAALMSAGSKSARSLRKQQSSSHRSPASSVSEHVTSRSSR